MAINLNWRTGEYAYCVLRGLEACRQPTGEEGDIQNGNT